MLLLLSPSKTLATAPLPLKQEVTQPALLKETRKLVKLMQERSAEDIAELMDVSEKIAQLNYERYQSFQFPFTHGNAVPAIRLFKGDVYMGLQADGFTAKELERAQASIRMLSGLYGVLKPFDLMQPYRLEMGIPLENPKGRNLYAFWGDAITVQLAVEKPKAVINLASVEYFKAVKPALLDCPVIECVFKEKKGKKLSVVALFAKKARGMMARYAVQENIRTPEGLKGFNEAGYSFVPELSSRDEYVFIR